MYFRVGGHAKLKLMFFLGGGGSAKKIEIFETLLKKAFEKSKSCHYSLRYEIVSMNHNQQL